MEAPSDRINDPYPVILYIYTAQHLKIYSKEISGLAESDRYDMTKYKWTEFDQELEDAVSTSRSKEAVMIFMVIYGVHIPTEVKNITLSYSYITQAMMV